MGHSWYGCWCLIAAQLVWPQLNFDTPWLTYSRLRPLHTNAVILRLVLVPCLQHLIMLFSVHVKHVFLVAHSFAFTFWGWQQLS